MNKLEVNLKGFLGEVSEPKDDKKYLTYAVVLKNGVIYNAERVLYLDNGFVRLCKEICVSKETKKFGGRKVVVNDADFVPYADVPVSEISLVVMKSVLDAQGADAAKVTTEGNAR